MCTTFVSAAHNWMCQNVLTFQNNNSRPRTWPM